MRKSDGIFLTKIPSEFRRIRKSKQRYKLTTCGLFEIDKDGTETIKVDYRYDICGTLIHELLHSMHKDWTERKVRQHERRYLRGLSQKQIFNLMRCFMDYAQLTKS